MNVLAEWAVGQVFWSMLWFFLFFIWIWLLITVFADIFRSPDMGGGAKAVWTIFVIVLPYLGVFVYLIARGHKMQEHAVAAGQGPGRSRPPVHPKRLRHQHQRRRRDRPTGRPEGQGRPHRGGVPGRQGQGTRLTVPQPDHPESSMRAPRPMRSSCESSANGSRWSGGTRDEDGYEVAPNQEPNSAAQRRTRVGRLRRAAGRPPGRDLPTATRSRPVGGGSAAPGHGRWSIGPTVPCLARPLRTASRLLATSNLA